MWDVARDSMPCATSFPLQTRRNSPYTRSAFDTDSRLPSCSTSRTSSRRSATRKSARCPPITISGSGAMRSVHCGGTEQTVASSTCNTSRLPDRLYRSPTHASSWPLRGWNGCVMRTRRGATLAPPAFWSELQTPLPRPVSLVADRGQSPGHALRPTSEYPLMERPSRAGRTRPRLAARPLRGSQCGLIIPRQPGTGGSKDCVAMVLERDQMDQRGHLNRNLRFQA
jgi:hypothetical protein